MSNTPITDDSALLDTVQVAQLLQMSCHYVIKHLSGRAKPVIQFTKLGNRLRFRPADVQEFIASRSKK